MIHTFKGNPSRAACGAPVSSGMTLVSAYTDDKYRTECRECRSILGLTLAVNEPRPEPAAARLTPEGIGPDPV